MRRSNSLALEVWQEQQRGKKKECWEGDAIEDAYDEHATQHGRGQDAGAFLRLVLAACHSGADRGWRTLSPTMRWISTKLQQTSSVSRLLEKVCV